jgi:O-antigen/teichoic acid export membrane protein
MQSTNVKASVLWLGFSELVNRLSALILLAVASRLLSSSEFSNYILFLTVTSLLWVMGQMGTTMHGTRFVCKSRIRDRASIIAGVTAIRLLLTLLFSVCLYVFHETLIPGVSILLVILGIAYVFLRALSIDWVLRAFDMSSYLAGLLTVSSVINVLFGVLFLLYKPNASILAYAMLLSYSVVCIGTWGKVIIRFYDRRFFKFNLKEFGFVFHFKKSSVIGLAGIAIIASQSIPVLSLNWFSDVETVGIFGGIQRILQIMLAPMSILSIAHFPQLARARVLGNLRKGFQVAYRHYFSDLIICAIWLTLGLAIFSNWLPSLLLGDRFSSSQQLVTSIALLIPLYYFRTSYSDSAIAMGNSYSVLFGCVTSLILTLTMCLFLVPESNHRMQLIYSILALGISEITVLIITVFFLWKVSGEFLFNSKYNNFSTWIIICGVLFCLYVKPLQITPDLLSESVAIFLSILVSVRLYKYSSLSSSLKKVSFRG